MVSILRFDAWLLPVTLGLAIIAVPGSALAEPTTQTSRQSLGSLVQAALDVSSFGPGYLQQLAALMASPPRERTTISKRVDDLVDGILAGGPPDEFLQTLIAQPTYADFIKVQHRSDWKYGSMTDRMKLVPLLWTEATGTNGTPDHRVKCAKAVLLFAVYDGSPLGEGYFIALAKDSDALAKVVNLTPTQIDRIKALVDQLQVAKDGASSADYQVAQAEAAIISGKSITVGEVQTEITALKQLWDAIGKAPGTFIGRRRSAIGSAWQLKNLAHARNSPEAVGMVDSLLRSWRAEDWGEPFNKWIDELLVTFGPPPQSGRIAGPGFNPAPAAPGKPKD